MAWDKQFEIIKKIIAEELARAGKKFTLANAAELLGVKLPKLQAWNKGQRPSADDLETLTRVLGLSADWVLLGNGLPTPNTSSGKFIPEYVEIGDTLNELVHQLPAGFSEVARAGGIGAHELTDYVNSRALPSCLTVANWIHAYHINANFLLAQIGTPFLTDTEYNEKGPLDWHRARRGDFDEPQPANQETVTDHLVARVEGIRRIMKELGASDEKILNAVDTIIQNYQPQPDDPSPSYNTAHEESEKHGEE